MNSHPLQSLFLPYAEFLRTWLYLPLTFWKETFESFFHPQLFLGCNIQDMNDEYHVLNEVGSYGKQISRIQKALDVLIAHPPADLSEHERNALNEYRAYTAEVAAALAASRGPQPHDLTTGYVDRLSDALASLRTTSPADYARVQAALQLLMEQETVRDPAIPRR